MTFGSAAAAVSHLTTTATIDVFVATGIAAMAIVVVLLLSAARRPQD